MNKWTHIIAMIIFTMFCAISKAQNMENIVIENIDGGLDTLKYELRLQRYIFKDKYFYDGEMLNEYLLPEMPVYAPLKSKNKRQRQQYNKLVYNVKKVLPLAQQVNALIKETYETLQMLPDEKSKDEHIKAVEKEIKRTYTPIMKKLTYSQGKLLIKLIDRECNQSSYEIVKAFLGPGRAAFYQVFAWTFRASLKKEYDPENDDRLVERVVQQVEKGLI